MTQTNITTNHENNSPLEMDSIDRVSTDHLLKGKKNLVIKHGENEYLLTVTRSNKLILTK